MHLVLPFDSSIGWSFKESRWSSETLLSIFWSQQPGTPTKRHPCPIVTIEEVTSDGHGGPDVDEVLQETAIAGSNPYEESLSNFKFLSNYLVAVGLVWHKTTMKVSLFYSIIYLISFLNFIIYRSTFNSWCSYKRLCLAHQQSGFAGNTHHAWYNTSSAFSFISWGGSDQWKSQKDYNWSFGSQSTHPHHTSHHCNSICNQFVLWSQHFFQSFSQRTLGIRLCTIVTQVQYPTSQAFGSKEIQA